MRRREVVTAFIEHRGRLILFKRSDKVSTYKKLWASVSGTLEAVPLAQAYREIKEETGLSKKDMGLPIEGKPLEVFDEALQTLWVVHPCRFELKKARRMKLDWEHTEMKWFNPLDMQKLDTVPGLYSAYLSTLEEVPPLPQGHGELRGDRSSGASELSLRAVENLLLRLRRSKGRTRKGMLTELARLALAQMRERPTMVSVGNAMALAVRTVEQRALRAETMEAFRHTASAALERVMDRMSNSVLRAASAAAAICPRGSSLMTLSHSSTILKLLQLCVVRKVRPIVLESRPLCEGARTAEKLARCGLDTRLIADAAAPHYAGEIDFVMVGADAVLPGGSVVNKIGTHLVAMAAREAGAKAFAVCETLKISPFRTVELEEGPPGEILENPPRHLSVRNPQFEVTPPELFDGIITERGVLGGQRVATIASEFRRSHRQLKRAAGEI